MRLAPSMLLINVFIVIFMELNEIRDLVQSDLQLVDQMIDNALFSKIKLISQLGSHLIHSGGKRLRPLLVLLSSRAHDYQGTTQTHLAAIIELIHTATLLHDDVVDASELRRGQNTANALWGNAASVLVGDFIYSRAFQMMVKINNPEVMQILATATNTIAEGEILQLLNCKNAATTEEQYMNVISSKTGALFSTATQMGPLLCNGTPEQIRAMQEYGSHLGIAFQLVDDALDYNTESQTLGKNRGDDLAEGKPTLPIIYAIQHGTPEQKHCLQQALEQASIENLDYILATIESTGAIAYTYQLAQQHAEKAIQQLKNIPDTAYRRALIALAKFAVKRSY